MESLFFLAFYLLVFKLQKGLRFFYLGHSERGAVCMGPLSELQCFVLKII